MPNFNKLSCYLAYHVWVYQNGSAAPLRRCVDCKLHQKYERLFEFGAWQPGRWVAY